VSERGGVQFTYDLKGYSSLLRKPCEMKLSWQEGELIEYTIGAWTLVRTPEGSEWRHRDDEQAGRGRPIGSRNANG
jgi:hypothetical protein